MLNGNLALEAPALDRIPGWVSFNYDLLHSFVVALAVIGITAIRCRWLAFTMLAWPFHIILDIPFHAKEYFPTRFLWPLSDVSVDGIPWTSPWIWYPNVAGICLLYLWRWRRTSKNNRLPQS